MSFHYGPEVEQVRARVFDGKTSFTAWRESLERANHKHFYPAPHQLSQLKGRQDRECADILLSMMPPGLSDVVHSIKTNNIDALRRRALFIVVYDERDQRSFLQFRKHARPYLPRPGDGDGQPQPHDDRAEQRRQRQLRALQIDMNDAAAAAANAAAAAHVADPGQAAAANAAAAPVQEFEAIPIEDLPRFPTLFYPGDDWRADRQLLESAHRTITSAALQERRAAHAADPESRIGYAVRLPTNVPFEVIHTVLTLGLPLLPGPIDPDLPAYESRESTKERIESNNHSYAFLAQQLSLRFGEVRGFRLSQRITVFQPPRKPDTVGWPAWTRRYQDSLDAMLELGLQCNNDLRVHTELLRRFLSSIFVSLNIHTLRDVPAEVLKALVRARTGDFTELEAVSLQQPEPPKHQRTVLTGASLLKISSAAPDSPVQQQQFPARKTKKDTKQKSAEVDKPAKADPDTHCSYCGRDRHTREKCFTRRNNTERPGAIPLCASCRFYHADHRPCPAGRKGRNASETPHLRMMSAASVEAPPSAPGPRSELPIPGSKQIYPAPGVESVPGHPEIWETHDGEFTHLRLVLYRMQRKRRQLQPVSFFLDTGADLSILLPTGRLSRYLQAAPTPDENINLRDASGNPLPTRGRVDACAISAQGTEVAIPFHLAQIPLPVWARGVIGNHGLRQLGILHNFTSAATTGSLLRITADPSPGPARGKDSSDPMVKNDPGPLSIELPSPRPCRRTTPPA